MSEWKFMPYAQGEMKIDPTESEFFTTTAVDDIATPLIREGTQNSLDEWLYRNNNKEKKPVNIKIFHSGNKYALKPQEYKQYFIGLEDHLTAKKNGIRNLPDLNNDSLKYLVFEDFNTNGLIGNPNECKDIEVEDGSKKHNFYHFWRNVGITGKPEDKLGRWGIGKTVFPVSSRINSFWGLTIQKDSDQELLLGQSVLKSHNVTANYQPYGYRPYGYFAQYNNGNFFPFAIDANDNIQKFKTSFRLKRNTEESGLSIIIPFIREEISLNSIIAAFILQYYLPLIKGELIVDITYEDTIIKIASDNLESIVNEYWQNETNNIPEKKSVIDLFNFIRWSLGVGSAEFYSLKEQPIRNQPRWIEKLWEGLQQEDLLKQYENEGRIAFKVPVKYQRKDDSSSATTCWFKVFFAKDDNLKIAETHFVRENITIIDIRSIKNPNVRAMVLVDDKNLSNLLGDSENPAHTQWQKDSQNFIDKYVDGDKCISFVISSISNIYQKLLRPAKGLEKDILKDIFFIPTEENDEPADISDDDSNKDKENLGEKDIPDIKSKRQMVRINKILGGLKVFPYGITKDNLPKIEIKIAYDTTHGNALSKYQKFDFELNKIPIKTIPKNCHFNFPESNVIRLNPYKEDFELTITGFDENRDLYIDLKTKYPVNDTEI